FAILGLRALYFLLAGVMDMFRYLKYGLALVLAFVGVKMLLGHSEYKIPINLSLIVIATILALSVIISLIVARREDVLHGEEGYVPEELPGHKSHPDSESEDYIPDERQ